jgi:hypothetical protein
MLVTFDQQFMSEQIIFLVPNVTSINVTAKSFNIYIDQFVTDLLECHSATIREVYLDGEHECSSVKAVIRLQKCPPRRFRKITIRLSRNLYRNLGPEPDEISDEFKDNLLNTFISILKNRSAQVMSSVCL